MQARHRLAAIMFTDITGYSAMMSKDEKMAIHVLEKNRAIHKSSIARFNGEYIKEVGDGTLAIFQSSVDAVHCALVIQKACCKETSLMVRIGIHTGDIILKSGDVFGDGVNIASRIEAAGEPGGIYISEKTYDDIKNQAGIRAEFYGEKLLKNIPGPVRIYSVSSGSFQGVSGQKKPIVENQPATVKSGIKPAKGFFSRISTRVMIAAILAAIIFTGGYFLIHKKKEIASTAANPEISINKGDKKTWMNSIAVLPFSDLSLDKDQEYFCDGMVDELINVLSHVPGLKVVARTSSFSFKGKETDVRDIGEQLNVKTILEGSVRKSGNQLRISAQLIDVNNGYNLWSQTFDRELKDVFTIQDDISSAIVNALKTKLLPEDKQQTENKQPKNTEAYELYLKGRFFWYKRGKENLEKSISYFEKSIAADPGYALAHAGLADAYYIQTWWGFNKRPDGFEKAKQSALRALELDKNLAEAYTTLSSVLLWNEWKWEESRKMYKQAISLNPNYGMAHMCYSELLDILCEYDEAKAEIDLAIELDPVYFMYQAMSSIYYIRVGRYDEALVATSRVQELNPEYNSNYWYIFYIYIKKGDDSRAMDVLQKCLAGDTSTINHSNTVRDDYNKSGMEGVLNILIEVWKKQAIQPLMDIAWFYAILKDKQNTLNWLEKALDEREPNVLRINTDPDYDFIRSEPRFLAMIEKMGLTPYNKRTPE